MPWFGAEWVMASFDLPLISMLHEPHLPAVHQRIAKCDRA
jgi:hypothetical protein